jgi:RNA polymerase sigma-70 factor (ECF subfamily)
VWQSAGRWRPETARLGTWIYRITVNVCIDRKRTGRRQAETFADIEMPDATDETVGPEQRIAARQHLGAVLAGISALPDDQRMALILSVQQNLSNREIAAAMATSEGAVEQLLVRARRALRVIHRSLT